MSQILIESLNFKLHMSVSFNLNFLHKFKGSDSLAYCKELRFLLLHPSEYFIRIGITVYQELGGSLHTQTWHYFFPYDHGPVLVLCHLRKARVIAAS